MSLQNIKNPHGGVLVQRVMDGDSSEENLLEQIFSTENMRNAWRRVRANRGAAGIDNVTVTDFPELNRPK